MNNKMTWWDYLPEEVQEGKAMLTEDDFWEAIACAHDLDYSEIADRDICEFI